MIIEEKDFRLTPIDESTPRFDLELLYEVRPKGKDSRLEFKNAGYGLSLDTAIKRVSQFRVSNNHKEEAVSLQTYFNEFKKEVESLTKLCEV